MSDFSDYPFPSKGWALIPEYMHKSVYRFVMFGVCPGRFLSLVIQDAAFGDVASAADDVNLCYLGGWAEFMSNYFPPKARREGYSRWIIEGGIRGREKTASQGDIG